MPRPEILVTDPAAAAAARQAHLIRTQERITRWQEKLRGTVTPFERTIIEQDLALLQTQLHDARTDRAIRNAPEPEERVNPLTELVLSLKAQVEELRAKLMGTKEPHGTVSKSQAPAPAA